MGKQYDQSIPTELQAVAKRLEAERPQASDLELDRIKVKAMARANPGTRAGSPGLRGLLRSGRLAAVTLAVVLMAGGGAVVAKNGGSSSASSSSSAAGSQYCPPSSPGAGKPKKPGPSKCGKP